MEVNIKTKFNVGEEVFVCRYSFTFKDGKYTDAMVVDSTPYTIESISITTKVQRSEPAIIILYIFDLEHSALEGQVFKTLKDAQLWCQTINNKN